MDIDLRTLSVTEIYAHSIPLRASGKAIKLSGRPSKLNDATRNRIENNLHVSLAKQRLRLTPIETENTSAQGLIHDFLCQKKSSLKLTSQALAKHLWSVQPGSSSAGMLLVARAMCNGEDAIALMKVDNELRVRHSELMEEDEVAFALSEIETLNMDAKKVFKAALFVLAVHDDGTPQLEILGSDHQAHGSDGHEVADFFLKDFLGCAQIDHPATLLRRIADIFLDHISDYVDDPVIKAQMADLFLAKLDDNNPTLNIDEVMSDIVPEEERSALTSKLDKMGITATEIEKDTSQLDDARYLSCILSNGLRVIGPKDTIRQMLQQEETDDGLQHLRIEGTIVEYKLRKRLS